MDEDLLHENIVSTVKTSSVRPADRDSTVNVASASSSRPYPARRTARGQPAARPHHSNSGTTPSSCRPSRDRRELICAWTGCMAFARSTPYARGTRCIPARCDRRNVARGTRAGLERVVQPARSRSAGCRRASSARLGALGTVPAIVEIVLTDRLHHRPSPPRHSRLLLGGLERGRERRRRHQSAALESRRRDRVPRRGGDRRRGPIDQHAWGALR